MKSLCKVLLVLMYCLSCVACATAPDKGIVLSSPDEIYRRDQPVTLTLQNNQTKAVSVYSNVEVIDESEDWVTWSFRLEDGRPNAVAIIYKLAPGESKTLTFDVGKAVLPPIPAGHRAELAKKLSFRFRVVAFDPTSDAARNEQFSKPFVIEQPYGSRAK